MKQSTIIHGEPPRQEIRPVNIVLLWLLPFAAMALYVLGIIGAAVVTEMIKK